MSQIEILRKNAEHASRLLRQAEAEETDRNNEHLLGKCFKYRNSGGGADGSWWLYKKVIRIKDGYLSTFQFQQYNNGQIVIEPDWFAMDRTLMNGGYIEIEQAEFDREWAALKEKIGSYSTS